MKNQVEGLFHSIDSMDIDNFLSYISSDCTFKFGNSEPAIGKEAVRSAVSGFFGMINGLKHDIENTWEIKNTIICNGKVTYTKKDNSKVTLPFCNVFVMDKGKIKEYLIYIDINPLF